MDVVIVNDSLTHDAAMPELCVNFQLSFVNLERWRTSGWEGKVCQQVCEWNCSSLFCFFACELLPIYYCPTSLSEFVLVVKEPGANKDTPEIFTCLQHKNFEGRFLYQ